MALYKYSSKETTSNQVKFTLECKIKKLDLYAKTWK